MFSSLALLLLGGLFSPVQASWYDTNWQYRKTITIDNTKVPNPDQIDFPVLVSHTDSDLRTTANGGRVQDSSGFDIIFVDGTDTVQLDHEIEKYVATTGEIVMWVRLPTVSFNTDTDFFIYYGNAGIASTQENVAGVWSNGYEAVYHLHDGFLDSTPNARNATNNGSTDVAGNVANGQDFTPVDDLRLGAWSVSGSEVTLQAWGNFDDFDQDDPRIVSKAIDINDEDHVLMLGLGGTGEMFPRMRIKTGTDDASGTTALVAGSGPLSVNTWHLVAGTYDGSSMRLFRDGAEVDSTSKTGVLRENAWEIWAGNNPTNVDTSAYAMDGTLDEIRVSSVARTEDWLTTEYNNQGSPGTFYTLGAQVGGISGTIYEDVNYGGGAGRTLATANADAPSFTIERVGANVELYDAAGIFLSSTTTAADGNYSFTGLSPALYTVRVVNSTLRSTRVGSDGTEVAVQTFRVDGDGETAGTGANRVGGEQPIDSDAPANSGSDTLAALQAPVGQYTQSIVTVDATGGDVAGADFGFNFDTIVNTNDANQGSLRRFLQNANLLTDNASLSQNGLTPAAETSIFMIPGAGDPLGRPADLQQNFGGNSGGEFTIRPLTLMQSISDPTILDGTTQTGFSGPLLIELDGSLGAVTDGLIPLVPSTIRGLVVNRFTDDGIDFGTSSDGSVVETCYVGTDVTGLLDRGNGDDGIDVSNSAGTRIGGLTAGTGNVISGNDDIGVILDGSATGALVLGNLVGVGADGATILGNGNTGIVVRDGVSGTRVEGNTVAHNAIGIGAWFDAGSGNAFVGNSVFLNAGLGIDLVEDGITPNDGGGGDADPGPNDLLNFPDITSATESGGTVTVDFDLDLLSGDYHIEFFKNPSGADPSGNGEGETFADAVNIAHAGAGPQSYSHGFAGTAGDVITVTTTECSDGPTCSTFGSTSEFSVAVTAVGVATISGRVFEDVDFAGTASDWDGGASDLALPNVDVELYDNADAHIASTVTDPGGNFAFPAVPLGTHRVRVRTATIGDSNTPPNSGFNGVCGVTDPPAGRPCSLSELTWAGGSALLGGQDPLVDDTTTNDDAGPGDTYVSVVLAGSDVTDVNFGVSYAFIVNTNDSGQGSLRQFIVNGNTNAGTGSTYFGIPISDPGHTPVPLNWRINTTSVLDDIIDPVVIDGTTQPGFTTEPVIHLRGAGAGPGVDGLTLADGSDGSMIRGLAIVQFLRDGIRIEAGADGITVAGNWIGSLNGGVLTAGNSQDGIELRASNATIGGIGALDGNVINNNGNEGINIVGAAATGNDIWGNYIGLEPDGTNGSGNADVGIAILTGASGNTIGGPSAAERNVISMNFEGIEVNSSNNVIAGNYIGTDFTGALDRGNDSDDGVEINSGTGNLVDGNLIAYNQRHGVNITGGTDHAVIGNRIRSNDLRGIDLGNNGVTANDAGDGDSGPNDLLNFPVITSATEGGGTTVVDYDLDLPFGNYRIEFFTNPSGADPTGNGEGEIVASSVNIGHAGVGPQSYSHGFAGAAGDIVTSTTTECTDGPTCSTFGSTSEFSAAVTVLAGADLSITKSDGQSTYAPGGSLTYTIVVSNLGPSSSVDASVADSFDVTRLTNINWGCVATGTADCGVTASGSGNISVSDADIATGVANFLTYTVTADVLVSATGNLVNTATVTANNESDLVPGNNSATDTDTESAEADLGITKTDGQATYAPGETLTYTIVVSNLGPSNSVDASVVDTFDVTRLTNINWGCVVTGTADCGATASSSGNISVSDVDVAAGAGNFLTYTVTADVLITATGNLVNTATVTANNETDLVAGNNSATDTDTESAEADLSITKTDGQATYAPGETLTYTIVVSNPGPSNSVDASVDDTFDVTRLTNINWGCVATGTANCGATASSSGNMSVSDVDVAAGAGNFLTYTVTADVLITATGNLVNTAMVTANNETDLVAANNSATDTDTESAEADLAITKTDGQATFAPGETLTYSIVVSNLGPSNAVDASVVDTFDVTRLTNINWNCVATGTADCGATVSSSGNISVSDVDIAAGAGNFLTYTVTADVLITATGNLVNTATVTANNGTDLVAGNNSATDTDTLGSEADLSITKTDGQATYAPGGSLTYTIVLSNLGPSNSVDASVVDTFDVTRLTNINWGCVATGTADCGATASASGNISVSDVDIAVGGGNFLTYTVTADVLITATGNLLNTATVTANNETDLVPANNTATDTDTLGPVADLSITKDDGQTSYAPGGTVTYTIVVGNAGPSDVVGATVTDAITALPQVASASWTCVAASGATCTAGPVVGDINETIDLPVGGTATYVLAVTLASTATGDLVNTASVAPPGGTNDPNAPNDGATDTDTLSNAADLSLAKVVDNSTPNVGANVVFTLTVNNAGPGDATGFQVADVLPAGYAYVSDDSGGAYDSSTGVWTVGNVPVSGSAALQITATVQSAGPYNNVAEIAAANELDPDSTPANGDPTEDDQASQSTVPVTLADLSLTQAVDNPTPDVLTPVTFTLTVTNSGPSDATGVQVYDGLPSGYTYMSDDGGGAYNPSDGMWNVGTITPVSPLVLNITANVEVGGLYTNQAEVFSAVEPDPDSTPGNGVGLGEDDEASLSTIPNGLSPIVLTKAANKDEVTLAEVVTYTIEIANISGGLISNVAIEDTIPPNFKFLRGSAKLDGVTMVDPAGPRPIVFGIGDLVTDAGLTLTYQLAVGAGATPGSYSNRALAISAGATSNIAQATVDVKLDEVFDLAVIIGKVFDDVDGDGQQDRGEPGIPGVMVALDDGTHALTDEYGRYHLPAIKPGQRMLKLNRNTLPPGAKTVGSASRVKWITPGLMVPVDFPVAVPEQMRTIGAPDEHGLSLVTDHDVLPIEVQGNAETLSVFVNDHRVLLSSSDVRLAMSSLDDTIQLGSGGSDAPITFLVDSGSSGAVQDWSLQVLSQQGELARKFEGKGDPPTSIPWDGTWDGDQRITGGEIYQYQLELREADGVVRTSPRRVVGINRTDVITLDLMGEAFETGKAILSENALAVLDEAGEILRLHPEDKVVVEGHTDSVGSRESNRELSRKRAEAAADYLVDVVGIERDRFTLRYFGEDQPIAPNHLEDGRALNRRVEVRGEFSEEAKADLLDVYRRTPEVRINGEVVEVGAVGQFKHQVDVPDLDTLTIEAADSQGRSGGAMIAVPTIEVLAPRDSFLVPFAGAVGGCTAGAEPDGGVTCRIEGSTEVGNSVEFGERTLEVAPDGRFGVDVDIATGENSLDFLVRNPQGYARVANLKIGRSDTGADGRRIVARSGAPQLSVNLPPRGSRLNGSTLNVSGVTDPGNRVALNGRPVPVNSEGVFAGTLELEPGTHEIEVTVRDEEDREGRVETEVDVPRHQLFLLAFADGKIGSLRSSGNLEAAGRDEKSELFTEGRLAFYLKGKIAGKYLISSAFASGRDEAEYLFENVDVEDSSTLLRNLDPDKFYPIYGDGSEVVYDAESRGRFYLAVDSEEIHALIGNYAMALTDTELATYQRTLYGGRFVYQSASRKVEGRPDTEVMLFAAEVQQAHVRDELRATGGSLYYLSHADVVEGSEQITLVLRDKTTGLILQRDIQQQNIDYTVKYAEGRVMFHRPLSSVSSGGSLVNEDILGGHPFFVQIDYETRLEDFEKTGFGVRARQQLGRHVSVGATHVEDEVQGGEYELTGIDARVQLGRSSRLILEGADSSGADSLVFVSQDGGITYNEIAVGGKREGTAWKATAELDVGAWFKHPDRYQANIYFKELESDFFSSGTFLEQGTRKSGINLSLKVSRKDSIRIRHDAEERLGTLTPGATKDTDLQTLQWERRHNHWGVSAEYRASEQEDSAGNSTGETELGAARVWAKPTEKLTARADHQQALTGESNDQTTVGVEYQLLPSLGLQLQGTDGSKGQSTQGGLVFGVGETQVYLTERMTDDAVGRRDTLILGTRAPLGPSSKVYTEYQWEDGASGEQLSSVMGLQRNWDLGPGFKFSLSGEMSNVESATLSTKRSAVNTGLFYQSADRVKARMRSSLRLEDGTVRRAQLLTFGQLDYKLNPDFTLLAKYRFSETRDRDLDQTQAKLEERSVGLAYRPVATNRLNALFRYTDLFDERPATDGFMQSTDRDVFSLDVAFKIHPRLESLSKAATRAQTEILPDTPSTRFRTWLAIERLNVGLWRQMELGVEYRILTQTSSEDRREGWLTEFGWRLHEHFRAGVGYNFTDFSDDEFSSNDYSVQGWFLRVQGMY